MKYAIVRQDGVTEIREDNYSLQDGCFVLNDEQFNQLNSGLFIFQNGEIVINPNPPKTGVA
jgi:hypothetical protein